NQLSNRHVKHKKCFGRTSDFDGAKRPPLALASANLYAKVDVYVRFVEEYDESLLHLTFA
ncbi:hypothetical protein M8C21_010345, partial [Ambrosia artemisiifolia]